MEPAIGDQDMSHHHAAAVSATAQTEPELTIIIVSYNTRDLSLACLQSLYRSAIQTRFQVVLIDNASSDGSADAIRAAYPQVQVISSANNLGFAAANNLVATRVKSDWLLLLNPDTEVQEGAIDHLLWFSKANPGAGITGGRTVFPDGRLNPASCWMQMTLWSALCSAVGLTAAFRSNRFFNPEAIGGWPRDCVREVDIVSGCFFMIRRDIWEKLSGFDEKYFMYGEEADLCLRAKRLGYQPMITPGAQIMHVVGASSANLPSKTVRIAKARATLIRDHWPKLLAPFGLGLLWLWAGLRVAAFALLAMSGQESAIDLRKKWQHVWSQRVDWLAGF